MTYLNYLKNKNLSRNTIDIYLKQYQLWKEFIKDRKPNKSLFLAYIKQYSKTHKPRSINLVYYSIISIFKFEKRWNLINQCKDFKLPSVEHTFKSTISLKEYEIVKEKQEFKTWYDKRNWLIFSFLFLTGVRVSELLKFDKSKIKNNIFIVSGKGDKSRNIYITDYLSNLLSNWKSNRIAISKNKKLMTTKQINIIVKTLSKQCFNKYITCHGLRRSFATNLLRNNVNLEIARKTLGHSNINTTSRYIHYNEEEIVIELKKVLD